jgi:hypothetical protein
MSFPVPIAIPETAVANTGALFLSSPMKTILKQAAQSHCIAPSSPKLAAGEYVGNNFVNVDGNVQSTKSMTYGWRRLDSSPFASASCFRPKILCSPLDAQNPQ